MRVISLHQPLASFMGTFKLAETRSWSTTYRGPIAIHAAKRNDIADAKLSSIWHQRAYRHFDVRYEDLPRGVIVSVGYLRNCVEMGTVEDRFMYPQPSDQERAFGIYKTGRFTWYIDNMERLVSPIQLRGQQGLWTLDDAVEQQILAAPRIPMQYTALV